MVAPLLSGCYGHGSSASPPANFTATAGDGRVVLEWTPNTSVDYWIFSATDPSLTAANWSGLANAHGYISARTPYYVCGLYNGTYSNGPISPMPYYFAANGRTNGGPGGESSPTRSATPYNASTVTWTTGTTTPTTPNIFGVGYASLKTCANITTSADGSFAAVGADGAIFTGTYAIGPPYSVTWTQQASPVTTDLHAVTGYAVNQNNASNPKLRWVAVGIGMASIYSIDGINWYIGTPYNATDPSLNSLTQVSGRFLAVGDNGTIISGTVPSIPSNTTGITWTTHTSNTLNNLNAVTRGNFYVAVGNSGTILTSGDGNSWSVKINVPTSSDLRGVATVGSIIVAVGNNGTIVTSKDSGTTWTAVAAPAGATNLVGVTLELQSVDKAPNDPVLGYVSKFQFVAVDDSGNAFASQNGFDWSSAAIGAANLNTVVSSGFGYVAAGNSGITAYAF